MTQEQIDNSLTYTLKEGDKVKMINCVEALHYKEKIWTCKTNSFIYPFKGKDEVVFLKGFSGCFSVNCLEKQ